MLLIRRLSFHTSNIFAWTWFSNDAAAAPEGQHVEFGKTRPRLDRGTAYNNRRFLSPAGRIELDDGAPVTCNGTDLVGFQRWRSLVICSTRATT